MAKKNTVQQDPISENDRVSDGDLDITILGLLAKQSTGGGDGLDIVRLNTLMNDLSSRGQIIDESKLVSRIERLLEKHSWFGLAWTNSRKDTLAPIAGVRWFCHSEMFDKLVKNKASSAKLAEEFAEAVQDFDSIYNEPRLLVDAGSTTFHCLFHERCKRLRKKVKENRLLTNNLFVALRWQEEFEDSGNVLLIGGMPHLDTAATIENEKLDQWLGAKSRQPHISLLSWHFAKPTEDGVVFYAREKRELEMKRAAMEMTTGRIYVVWGKDKATDEVPQDAVGYSMAKFLDQQQKTIKTQEENGEKIREVFLITDIEEPNEVQKKVIALLSNEEFTSSHIRLISPSTKEGME